MRSLVTILLFVAAAFMLAATAVIVMGWVILFSDGR